MLARRAGAWKTSRISSPSPRQLLTCAWDATRPIACVSSGASAAGAKALVASPSAGACAYPRWPSGASRPFSLWLLPWLQPRWRSGWGTGRAWAQRPGRRRRPAGERRQRCRRGGHGRRPRTPPAGGTERLGRPRGAGGPGGPGRRPWPNRRRSIGARGPCGGPFERRGAQSASPLGEGRNCGARGGSVCGHPTLRRRPLPHCPGHRPCRRAARSPCGRAGCRYSGCGFAGCGGAAARQSGWGGACGREAPDDEWTRPRQDRQPRRRSARPARVRHLQRPPDQAIPTPGRHHVTELHHVSHHRAPPFSMTLHIHFIERPIRTPDSCHVCDEADPTGPGGRSGGGANPC